MTLTVRQIGPDLRVVAETSEPGLTGGVRVEESLELDLANLPHEFALTAEDLRQYGQVLGQAVFHGEVLSTFERIQARADADGQPLHVLLSIEVERLRAMRWERLCSRFDRKKWKFLRLQQRTPFSIYLPSEIDKRYRTTSRVELKALVVVANLGAGDPYGLAEFKAGPVVESIRQALGEEIPCTVLASDAGKQLPGASGLPTLSELCRWLTAERFPILHIVCHGKFEKGNEKNNRPDETFLHLRKSDPLNPAKPDDHIERVPATTLIDRLGELQGAKTLPHLTFLSSCETASPKAEQGLGGLGQRLVRELGMPAVVAMTEPIELPLAQQLAGEFYKRLRQHGSVDLALDEACAGIADRGDVLIPTLFSRLGGRKLFDETGPLTSGEWDKGLERLGPLIGERAPAIRPAFEELAGRARAAIETRKRTETSLPNDAQPDWARDELQKKLQPDLNELCEDFLEQSFDALARGLPLRLPTYDARCPFPGLGAFDVVKNERGEEEDFRPFFFGRRQLTEKVCGLLREHRFLAVLGGSGTGKSSLVRAGVLEQLGKDKPNLRVVIFPPGKDPVGRLRQERMATPDPDVLVVDQFEELFSLCTDAEARKAFLAELLPLREQCPVVITMRTDFLGECGEHDELHALLNSATKHLELLQPLRGDELREVVEQQRNAVGLQFEPELAKRIFEDLEHEPGAMPLLQHCLRQLWNHRRGRNLRFVDYLHKDRVGGVKGAISKTADEVYAKLSPAEQDLCPFIFERLVRIDTEATDSDVRRDTRQREELSQLIPEGGDSSLTKAVVTRLADSKLLITTQNPLTQATEVEVAHEALIRHWEKLIGWIANARVTARLVERVRTEAGRYYASQANTDNLTLRGVVLSEAETLLHAKPPRLTHDEAEFIRSSRHFENKQKDFEIRNAQEREQLALGRARWAIGAAVVSLVGVIITGLLAWYAWNQRNRTVLALEEKGRAIDTLKAINRGQKSVFDTIDSKLGDNVLFQELAVDVYAKVADTFQKELLLRPEDTDLRRETAEMLIAYAWHLNDIGRPLDAIPEYQRAEKLLETIEQSNPNDVDISLRRTFVMNNIAWAMSTAGHYNDALAQNEKTLVRRRELLKEHPTNVECRRQVAVSLSNLANSYSESDTARAKQYYQESISLYSVLWAENPRNRWNGLNLASTTSDLASVFFDEGNLDTAIELKSQAFHIAKRIHNSAKAGEPSDDGLGVFSFQEKHGKYATELAGYRLRKEQSTNEIAQIIEEGLTVLKEMHDKSPTNQRYAFLYSRALQTKARWFLFKDDLESAHSIIGLGVKVVDIPASQVPELRHEYRAAMALQCRLYTKQGSLQKSIEHLTQIVRLHLGEKINESPSIQILEDLAFVIDAVPAERLHGDPAVKSLLVELKALPPERTKWVPVLLKCK